MAAKGTANLPRLLALVDEPGSDLPQAARAMLDVLIGTVMMLADRSARWIARSPSASRLRSLWYQIQCFAADHTSLMEYISLRKDTTCLRSNWFVLSPIR